MQVTGASNEVFNLVLIGDKNIDALQEAGPGEFRIFWNSVEGFEVEIDGVCATLGANEIIFLTEFDHIKALSYAEGRLFKFNRSFYCLDIHDREVGCKGILFFGGAGLSLVKVGSSDLEIFELLWRVFFIEMQARDNLQLEMLRMLLKRWIILCVRLYKRSRQIMEIGASKIEVVREFHLLVEQYYRLEHDVKSYAARMNKSPKTIANLFSKYKQRTPSQVIQDRVLQEARRQLRHSTKSVTEIAYEIGFEDIQAFSRFFRTKMGMSPKSFREMPT